MAKCSCNFSIWRINLMLCAVLMIAAGEVSGESKSPLETVRASNEAILAIYASTAQIDSEALHRIFTVMDRATDYEVIAGRTVHSICPDLNSGLCPKIRDEFIELLQLTATRKLGSYRADRFEYLTEEVKDGTGYVQTIAHFKDDSVNLRYHLENREGDWRIVNYIVDDVDTIRNYQRQFKRIVEKESLVGLFQRLRTKNEQYRKEE